MATPVRTLLNNTPLHAGRPVCLLWYLPWLALLGYLTHIKWFLTDDAFISFRYVRNLCGGPRAGLQ